MLVPSPPSLPTSDSHLVLLASGGPDAFDVDDDGADDVVVSHPANSTFEVLFNRPGN